MSNESPGRADRSDLLDLEDAYQIRQWTEIYDCSVADLGDAVQMVGPRREDVKRYLRLLKS